MQDDLISRQAVLDIQAKYAEHMGATKFWQMRDDIKTLSSVKPQERTGHWKRISIDKYSEHAKYWYRCDRCGEHNLGNTDWCPNCGARMVEPKLSENPTGSKDVIWYSKRNYSEIVVEPQERREE